MHNNPGSIIAGVDPRVLIAALIVAVILLVPGWRRSLHGLLLQMQGLADSRVLSKRPRALVVEVVKRKIERLSHNAEAVFQRWMRAWRRKAVGLAGEHDAAVASLDAAERRVAELQRAAANECPRTMPPRSVTPRIYNGITVFLGICDVAFTFLALELFDLPTVFLIPTAVLLGGLAVVFGHLAGQAFHNPQRRTAYVVVAAATVYAFVLGTMRFAYVNRQSHDAVFGNAVSSWGIIVVLVAASALLSHQLAHNTPLEKANRWRNLAILRRDRAFRRGEQITEALRARMLEKRAHTLALVRAYQNGFNMGWTTEPIPFPEVDVREPEGLRWPPATSSSPTVRAGVTPLRSTT